MKLVPKNNIEAVRALKDALEEAEQTGCDGAIVFLFRGDETWVSASRGMSTTEKLGALEQAKWIMMHKDWSRP